MLIDMGKTILAKMIHAALRVMLVFPIKRNRVVFFPGNGHYYCNLMAERNIELQNHILRFDEKNTLALSESIISCLAPTRQGQHPCRCAA